MKAKSAALALAMMVVLGCTPTRLWLRHKDGVELPPVQLGSAAKAQGLAPKRCDVRVAVLSRPLGDAGLNEAVWRVADEQAVPDDLRRGLAANGLRMGLVPGTLPGEVMEILAAPPPHQVEPTVVNLPSGENTLIPLSPTASKLSLMLNLDGRVSGRDYSDAHGFLRLTMSHDPSGGVALRFVPELHHGPILHRYAADDASNPFSVQQFVIKDGQQEETLRQLASTFVVQRGQVMVVGCWPDRQRSLGYFLFTEPEANSDRLIQKLILIWASQGKLDPILPNPPTLAAPTSEKPPTIESAANDAQAAQPKRKGARSR